MELRSRTPKWVVTLQLRLDIDDHADFLLVTGRPIGNGTRDRDLDRSSISFPIALPLGQDGLEMDLQGRYDNM